MIAVGDLPPGDGRASDRQFWIDPAGPEFLAWERTWP